MAKAGSTEKVVREIRRHTRRRFSAEEKIRIVLEGLRGEESIAALCRREGLKKAAVCSRGQRNVTDDRGFRRDHATCAKTTNVGGRESRAVGTMETRRITQ